MTPPPSCKQDPQSFQHMQFIYSNDFGSLIQTSICFGWQFDQGISFKALIEFPKDHSLKLSRHSLWQEMHSNTASSPREGILFKSLPKLFARFSGNCV